MLLQAAEPVELESILLADRRRKGTLRYTQYGLVLLFFYLLWGDFVLNLMENMIPSLLPLQLKPLGASNTSMALIIQTLPSCLNLVINPTISVHSDRCRSGWGRRIPYLLFITPIITTLLVLMAFSPEIAVTVRTSAAGRWIAASPNTVIISTLGVLLVLFQIFNMMLQPIYYYLLVDVIPDAYMGRFMALFRIVATAQLYLFNTFIFGHALTHTRAIYIGCALAYGLGFMVMSLQVKEGNYRPPASSGHGLWRSIRVYSRECYSNRHYLYFNLRNACWTVSGVVGMYGVFVFRDDVGVSLPFIGKVQGWTNLLSLAMLYPLGMLCDRYSPVRTSALAMCLAAPLTIVNFFFLHSQASYVILAMISVSIYSMVSASELPLYAAILPRDRYGQFGSANQLIISIAVIAGSFTAGLFMDHVTAHGQIIRNYRYLYFWNFTFQSLAIVFMTLLYGSWLKNGGQKNHRPPGQMNRT